MHTADSRMRWNDYFMKLAHVVAERSTCRRRQIGAVLVKDKRIIATGYNGAPTKIEHCLERGCRKDEVGAESGKGLEVCPALHAEQNCLLQCAKYGIVAEGSALYCTLSPCIQCAKELINAGVRAIIYDAQDDYPDKIGLEMLTKSDVALVAWNYGGGYENIE